MTRKTNNTFMFVKPQSKTRFKRIAFNKGKTMLDMFDELTIELERKERKQNKEFNNDFDFRI